MTLRCRIGEIATKRRLARSPFAGITLLILASAALPNALASHSRAPLLPVLVQRPPRDLIVIAAGRHWRLGFTSAVDNDGHGPLLLRGHRPRGSRTMTVDQIVRRGDGSTFAYRGVGSMRYVRNRDHQHWHLLGFERYTLRRAGDPKPIRPDRKTGFCLGDRYEAVPDVPLAGRSPAPTYTGHCALRRPAALTVTEGIAPGYGDDYGALLEGQYIDITGLRAGAYLLVHQVNVDRRLHEASHAGDVAAARFDLNWPRGPAQSPEVRVTAECAPLSRCQAPRH